MFLNRAKSQGPSAAWRIAIWPTVAFALGSAVAFAIMYLLIAKDIRERSDAWLSGEAEVLADVSANTPRDALYDRLVGEVAELASREVPHTSDSRGDHQNSVFFLQKTPGQEAIWVGPMPRNDLSRPFRILGWYRVSRVMSKCRGGKKHFVWFITPTAAKAACISALPMWEALTCWTASPSVVC